MIKIKLIVVVSLLCIMCNKKVYEVQPMFKDSDAASIYIYPVHKKLFAGDMLVFYQNGSGEYWSWDNKNVIFVFETLWETKNDTVVVSESQPDGVVLLRLVADGKNKYKTTQWKSSQDFYYYEKVPALPSFVEKVLRKRRIK